jgi:hypothetical protein
MVRRQSGRDKMLGWALPLGHVADVGCGGWTRAIPRLEANISLDVTPVFLTKVLQSEIVSPDK